MCHWTRLGLEGLRVAGLPSGPENGCHGIKQNSVYKKPEPPDWLPADTISSEPGTRVLLISPAIGMLHSAGWAMPGQTNQNPGTGTN